VIPADEFDPKPETVLRFAAELARADRSLRGWFDRRARPDAALFSMSGAGARWLSAVMEIRPAAEASVPPGQAGARPASGRWATDAVPTAVACWLRNAVCGKTRHMTTVRRGSKWTPNLFSTGSRIY
jgi:hypothetical protein